MTKRPEKFHSFTDSLSWLKRSVYLIARGRVNTETNEIKWISIGTGFICAPERLVTASHVINDAKSENPLTHHQSGDMYYLIHNDDDGRWHYRFSKLELDKDIFLYPDLDLAVIHLEKEFYQKDDKIFVDRNDFIRISKDSFPIGTEIGVLGYPLCKLDFEDKNVNKPLIGNILLRADKGVINTKYFNSSHLLHYEFTLSFNPGNSGGPIFDLKSGRVISIVHGFRPIKILARELELEEEEKKIIKQYNQKHYIDLIKTNYSLGFGTASFLEVFKKHNITS